MNAAERHIRRRRAMRAQSFYAQPRNVPTLDEIDALDEMFNESGITTLASQRYPEVDVEAIWSPPRYSSSPEPMSGRYWASIGEAARRGAAQPPRPQQPQPAVIVGRHRVGRLHMNRDGQPWRSVDVYEDQGVFDWVVVELGVAPRVFATGGGERQLLDAQQAGFAVATEGTTDQWFFAGVSDLTPEAA